MGQFAFDSLAIPAVGLVRAKKISDARGFFAETYTIAGFKEIGITCHFVQENQAFSHAAGTIRGLHFQRPPAAQSKLVRVVRGAIFDVAVDLRRGSATYGKWCGARLSAEGGEQLFVPHGFAHGYCTLQDNTDVIYKIDHVYRADHEGGVLWSDPDIGVSWPIESAKAILSEKDKALPTMRTFDSPF